MVPASSCSTRPMDASRSGWPSPPVDHRHRRRTSADGERGRPLHRHLQRRDLQLPRAPRGAAGARPSLPNELRHRGLDRGLSRLGPRGNLPVSRHVCLRVCGIPEGAKPGARARCIRQEAIVPRRRGLACFCSPRRSSRSSSFPGFDRTFNIEALGHYLLNRYVPGPTTFFRAMKKLAAGTLCGVEGRQLHHQTATSRRHSPTPRPTSPRSTKRYGCSKPLSTRRCASACAATRRSAPISQGVSIPRRWSRPWSSTARAPVGPSRSASASREYSELDHARVIAEQFGTDHQELVVEPQAFMDDSQTAVLRRGAPVSEASDIPIFMLSKLLRKA